MDITGTAADLLLDGLLGDASMVDGGQEFHFHSAAHTAIAQCAFNADAFAAASGGTAAMNSATAVQDTGTVAGDVDHSHFVTTAGMVFSQLTCGTSSASEMVFSSLTIGSGETLTVDSFGVSFTVGALI